MQFNITIDFNFYLGDNPFCAVTDLYREGLTNTTYFLPSLGNLKIKIAQKYKSIQDM